MAILRVGWSYWRSLSQTSKDNLLAKYDVVTITDEHYREKFASFSKVIGKPKETKHEIET